MSNPLEVEINEPNAQEVTISTKKTFNRKKSAKGSRAKSPTKADMAKAKMLKS